MLLDELLLVWVVAGPIDFILINKKWLFFYFTFSLFLRIFGWNLTACVRLPYQIGDQQEEEEERKGMKNEDKRLFQHEKGGRPHPSAKEQQAKLPIPLVKLKQTNELGRRANKQALMKTDSNL